MSPLTGIGSGKSLLEHRAPPGRDPLAFIMLVNHGGDATQPRAPGHDRPRAALRAARHGRLSAASTAPGADVPPAITAGAPGQYCLSAAPRAPGHGRPLATTAGVPGHDRLSAALGAPTDDLTLASTAKAAGHHRPSAALLATVALPAGTHRLRQEGLPHTPANPRTLTYPHSHHTVSSLRRKPQSTQAHPAIQEPPHPWLCSTTRSGFSRQHPSRAPPTAAGRKNLPL